MTTTASPTATSPAFDNNVPFKILEINVISAHDLPPVVKLMRTYVLARLNTTADNRQKTHVDRNGHTNPTWNFKMNFRVDEKFLKSRSSAIIFDIYNVAWLRDLPIGTARIPIQSLLTNLSSSSSKTKPSKTKPQTLQVSRPSGHLKGTLNVSINLVNPPNEKKNENESNHQVVDKEEKFIVKQLQGYESEELMTNEEEVLSALLTNDDDSSLTREKPKSLASSVSIPWGMRRLPSEVMEALELEIDSNEQENYERNIDMSDDNWRGSGGQGVKERSKSRSFRWDERDDQFLINKNIIEVQRRRWPTEHHRRSHSDGGGLLSCFGKGFEFTFICGSGKKKMVGKSNHYPGQENLHKFYI